MRLIATIRIWTALSVCAVLSAQGLGPGGRGQPSVSRHITWGTVLPTSCVTATGDVFFLTSGTVGLYQCVGNVFVQVTGGGGGAPTGAAGPTVLNGTYPDPGIGALKITNGMLAGPIPASKFVLSDIVLPESQITSLVSDLSGKQASLGFTPLNPANNLSELVAATARTNLGLGSLAVLSALPTTSLTGTLQAAQEPAFTGDVGKSAGSLVTLVGQIHDNLCSANNAASPYSVPASCSYLACDATAGAVIINLPAATGSGREISVKKTDSTANACTPTRNGSDVIDGATSYSLTVQYAASKIVDRTSGNWDRSHVNQLAGDVTGIGTATVISGLAPSKITGTAAVGGGTLSTVGAVDCTSAAGIIGECGNIFSDISNITSIRNSTSPQTLRLYGTYTDPSNYVRLSISSAGDPAIIVQSAGTGTAGHNLNLVADGGGVLFFYSGATLMYNMRTTDFEPNGDNNRSLGTTGLRWSTVFSGKALIGGSTAQNYALAVTAPSTSGLALFQDLTPTTGNTRVTVGLGAADSASTVTLANAGTTKSAGYQSSDGSAGVTGSTCTAWKNGLCTTP